MEVVLAAGRWPVPSLVWSFDTSTLTGPWHMSPGSMVGTGGYTAHSTTVGEGEALVCGSTEKTSDDCESRTDQEPKLRPSPPKAPCL